MGSIAGEDVGDVGAGGKLERILVSVRVRPLNGKELERHDTSDWECINANTIIFKNNLPERSMFPAAYTFDRVFGCDTTTKQVYEEGAKEVALSVVSGINSSIFAYGQTSSGKTYTMTGITGYAVTDIYEYIKKHPEREFKNKFSAMEIYNEAVRDLLSPDSAPLRLLDDPEKGTIVEKLTEEPLRDQDHVMELLSFCAAQRQIGETSLNEMSSRSHQILRLTIESSARQYLGMGKSSTLLATVNFVDLAGSERASQALSAGARLKEGCHINRSLLTLGTVIRKLSKGRNGHIPYRDSKLTRILQSSLGGNAKTAIICTMSPARSHIEQSRNTLLFATCAKEVATNAQVNVVMSDKALVKHLQKELARLENELRYSVPTSTNSCDALKEKDAQIKKMEKEMKELMQQRDLAQSRLEDLLRALGDDQGSRQWDELSQSSIPHVISCEDTLSISETSGGAYQSPDFGYTKYCSARETKDCAETRTHLCCKTKEQHASSSLHHSTRTCFVGQEVSHFTSNDYKDQCKEVRCIEMDEPSMNIIEDCDLLLTEVSDSFLPHSIDAQEPAGPEPKPKEEKVLKLEPSPLPKVSSSPRGLKLSRSRSCRATVTTTSSPWFHEDENKNTPPNNFLRDFPGRPEGTRKKPFSINYGAELEKHSQDAKLGAHSRNGSRLCAELEKHSQDAELGGQSQDGSRLQTSEQNISDDVFKPQNINTCLFSINCGAELEKHSRDAELGAHSRDGSIPQTSEQSISDVITAQSIKTCQFSINCGAELEKHSQDAELGAHSPDGLISQNSEQSTPDDILKPQNIKTCPDNDINRISDTVEGLKEMAQIQYQKQLSDGQETENYSNCDSGVNITVKDVCLEPVLKSSESPSRWPLEFEKKQREIVVLWHKCNVSLIHRSYFFLLIKGDPTDSFYIEVEYRRLSFLRHSLSEGSLDKTTAEDGQSDSLALRTLRRERDKIWRGLNRLPAAERESLYTKWGIALDSKQRRLQLSRRVWTETNDMEHARESAMLVAKVLRFLEPAQAPKEMFGLSFSPQLTSRRSFGWRNSMSSFR